MFDIGRPDEVRGVLDWRCHLLKPGETIAGVSVGPMVCPVVHWRGRRSVPCLREMTGGELLCACDQEPAAKRRIAYLPMISGEGEKVVIILSNGVAVKLGALPHRTLLRVSKSKTPCAPVAVVRVMTWDVPATAQARADKMPPQDIREYLLNLWSLDILTRWCTARVAVQEAVANLVDVRHEARENIGVPSPAASSGATEIRRRLRRGASSG